MLVPSILTLCAVTGGSLNVPLVHQRSADLLQPQTFELRALKSSALEKRAFCDSLQRDAVAFVVLPPSALPAMEGIWEAIEKFDQVSYLDKISIGSLREAPFSAHHQGSRRPT